ncbi:alpha/beta hydrolase [Ferrimicrobium sp.]|uniref:alpha/beta fold hydrolase n=1 Tax=Ferrimicrobium sp. TaxID=2926050 RepID=UPI00261111CC|nr:alpha/beta hydrolase [Ferrimicrobium sp.]
MTDEFMIANRTIVYEESGEGPLVLLAHGIGDSRHSYRFIAPALTAAGYRVVNIDLRGCGDSSLGWGSYSRSAIASDLVSLVRHLGGPAVIIGHSISGGAATISAATAPDVIAGLIELAPFTRVQSLPLRALAQARRYRRGTIYLVKTIAMGSLTSWRRYLELAYPTKPHDWEYELARIEAKLSEPGRMRVLRAMGRSNPSDAGEQLARVRCPVLVIEGSADPDWSDPGVEGKRIIDALPDGIGELVVLEGRGHYLHAEAPDQVLQLALPFLARVLSRA